MNENCVAETRNVEMEIIINRLRNLKEITYKESCVLDGACNRLFIEPKTEDPLANRDHADDANCAVVMINYLISDIEANLDSINVGLARLERIV